MKDTRDCIKTYEKSSFPYWFAHWCAFNMTAIRLGAWRPYHLFHDWYKPYLKLFLPYKYVQKIHRKFSPHHPESCVYKNYTSMIIDWECSGLTKPESKLNARETMEQYYPELRDKLIPVLNKLSI